MLVLGGTGSVRGGPGGFLVILSQYRAVLVGTWWYWVSVTWYYSANGPWTAEMSKKNYLTFLSLMYSIY